MSYTEMKNAVVNAIATFRSSKLREIASQNPAQFEEIIEDIELEIGVPHIVRFWEF